MSHVDVAGLAMLIVFAFASISILVYELRRM